MHGRPHQNLSQTLSPYCRRNVDANSEPNFVDRSKYPHLGLGGRLSQNVSGHPLLTIRRSIRTGLIEQHYLHFAFVLQASFALIVEHDAVSFDTADGFFESRR